MKVYEIDYESYEKRAEIIEEWFDHNGKGFDGIALLADDIEMLKDEYIDLQVKIDVALDVLEKNNFFETINREEFKHSNEAFYTVMTYIFHLDNYDLPRSLIILLPENLLEKALDFLLDKLVDIRCIDEYFDIVEN